MLSYKVNDYITLRLEHGKTFIYVNGTRFYQCIRLVLNIPKTTIPDYDHIDSIDEATEIYDKYIWQNITWDMLDDKNHFKKQIEIKIDDFIN